MLKAESMKKFLIKNHKKQNYASGLSFFGYVKKENLLYVMIIPVVLWFLIFCYVPMFGIIIAFQRFYITKGFFGSEWVGLRNFEILFNSPDFILILTNTLMISLKRLVFGFPAPIILALMFNEVRNTSFKRIAQTISYMPHFLSWVIVSSLITEMLSLGGPVNSLVALLGYEKQQFLMKESLFQGILVVSGIWKEVGWGTLLYLAAMAGIDPQLYESSVLDGANRWNQTIHITIPSIKGIIIILLIFSVGGIMNAGFEQVFLLQNPMVRDVSEIIDTFVYKAGIVNANYSYASAVGVFKSVVGFILVLSTNYIARKTGEDSLF